MSPEELQPNEGISRRKMLKRIGAGAAIAWTAPVLTSIRTPAFAVTPGGCGNGCPDSCANGDFGPCSPPQSGCQSGSCEGGLGCFGQHDVSGTCHCFQNIFCTCVTACSTNADCGSGQFCTDNGCGRTCLYCCGCGGGPGGACFSIQGAGGKTAH